jgi:hypothetical protein
MTIEELGRLIERSLKRSNSIEIDGLGVFARNDGAVTFHRSNGPRIFIAYASEDRAEAERIFDGLAARGYSPWIDRRRLLPGQNWPERIEDAILSSDFFIACFSNRSVKKRGGFQTELRYALECAASVPLDDVFFIPVRLENCKLPARIERETQAADLFPDWHAGFGQIVEIIERQIRRAA